MNWAALSAGVITLLAFLAHSIGGSLELRYVAPVDETPKAAEVRQQIINGWHWVSVDLLLAAVAFFLVATTDLVPDESAVLSVLSIYFLIIGTVWLTLTAMASRMRPMLLLRLGQWSLCLVLAALAWFAR